MLKVAKKSKPSRQDQTKELIDDSIEIQLG